MSDGSIGLLFGHVVPILLGTFSNPCPLVLEPLSNELGQRWACHARLTPLTRQIALDPIVRPRDTNPILWTVFTRVRLRNHSIVDYRFLLVWNSWANRGDD